MSLQNINQIKANHLMSSFDKKKKKKSLQNHKTRRVNYDFTSCAKQNNLKHAIPALAGNVSSAVLIKFIQL